MKKKVIYTYKKLLTRYQMMKRHPLTKSAAPMAMYRYLSFSISQSLFPKFRIHNWMRGLKFYVTKGDAGLVGGIYYKLMDYEDSMFIINHAKKDSLFVDVGSNLGHFSLIAARICGVNVVAFEPVLETFKRFNESLNLNELITKINA